MVEREKKAKTEEIPDEYVRRQAKEFLDSLQISESQPPSWKVVLQLLIASLLLSARMSQDISTRTFVLLKDEYDRCDFEKLSKATWDELCDVALTPISTDVRSLLGGGRHTTVKRHRRTSRNCVRP